MKCSLSKTTFWRKTSSCRIDRRHEAGFTFAEVLAAMIFMAILLPVVMQGLVLANRASVTAERKRIAVHLANSMLTELIATDQWRQAGSRGNFAPDHELYEWELIQSGWDQDDMQQLTLVVTYPVQGQSRRVQLTTLVDDSQQ
jgi:Tfp pilus assembly protein PilV